LDKITLTFFVEVKKMRHQKLRRSNAQGYLKGHQDAEFQRCEFCNVPIFRNACSDERSISAFQGKGKILCNKCANIIGNMPEEQALQALNNASETYPKRVP
jgi:Zn-finger protein